MNYKQATKQKLRFVTPKGLLSIEQLWDLKVSELKLLIIEADETVKKSTSTLDFLAEDKRVDEVDLLKFEILKDIYLTKRADQDAVRKAKEDKEYNEKILALIDARETKDLEGKSVEELKALLRKS